MIPAMRKSARNISLPFFFTVAFAGIFALINFGASAAPSTPEGCDPKVEKAQQSRAEARTAYDVAVTEEHIEKPDNIEAMTCMNDLAGIAAAGSGIGAGTVFSGPYTNQSPSGNAGGLSATIVDGLQTMFTGYVDAMGADSGLVPYTNTALTNTGACNSTQDLWTQVKQGGVEEGVPNATLTDLLSGSLPGGANADYSKDWSTSNGSDNVANNYQTDLAAQPPSWMPTYVQTSSMCQQMITANIPGAACP